MRSSKIGIFFGLGLLALTPTLSQPSAAQSAVHSGFVGSAKSSVAGCPNLMWRLARDGNNLNGIAYYSDMSGLSHVTGSVTDAGMFTLSLTSVMGNGPVATVTGQRSAPAPNQKVGALEADISGKDCANAHVMMAPVDDLNQYGGTGASFGG